MEDWQMGSLLFLDSLGSKRKLNEDAMSEEEKKLALMMLPKKKKVLYDKIMHSKKKKAAKVPIYLFICWQQLIMILQRASWEFYINWSIEPSVLRYKVVLMIEMCVYERGMKRGAGVLYKKWIIVNLSNQLSHQLSRKVWYVWEIMLYF